LIGGLMGSGPLTRTVGDAAGILDVLSGYVTGDRYWVWVPDPGRSFAGEVGREPGRLRVGLITSSPLGGVHADCVAAAEDAAVQLEELGHYVSPAELAPTEDYVRDFQIVWFASVAATAVPDWRKTERKTLEQDELGRQARAPDYLWAISALQRSSRRLLSSWEEYDLLLTPTLARPPFRIGTPESFHAAEMVEERFRFSPFTPVFNVTGQRPSGFPSGGTTQGSRSGCSWWDHPRARQSFYASRPSSSKHALARPPSSRRLAQASSW
jgi:amidase